MKKLNKINIVGSIGNLPSSYNASLSYEEQVSYLWNYIKSLNLQNIADRFNQIATQINNLNVKINETDINIGDLENLSTLDKTSIVNSINEIFSNITSLNTDIGDLTELSTSDKTNIVNAINETFNLSSNNSDHIGTLNSLNTSYKNDLVGAINEVGSQTDNNTTNISNLSYKAGDSFYMGGGGCCASGFVQDNGTSAYIFIPLSKPIDDIEHVTVSFNTDATFALMNHEKRFYYHLSEYSSYDVQKEYNGLRVYLNFKSGDTMTARTPCVCHIRYITITFS